MKQLQALSLFLIISLTTLAQVKFERGYIVDIKDQKTECLVRNGDWDKNPREFKYKLTEAGEVQTGDPSSIKEFGIDDVVTYRSAEVDIDVSPTHLNRLSDTKNPIWERKNLFLKVLVEGKGALYSYDSEYLRFFYSVNNGEIKQLVRKEYLIDQNIATNNAFRQQLFDEVNCASTIASVQKLGYYKKELMVYFQRYNKCADPNYKQEQRSISKGREIINLSLTAGFNSTVLAISQTNTVSDFYTDFGIRQSYNVGLESELIPSFQNNRWAIVAGLNYQEYNSSMETDLSYSTVSLHFTNVDLGFRRYLFLMKDAKIHIGGNFNIGTFLVKGDYEFKEKNQRATRSGPFDLTKVAFYPSFSGFGAGLKYRNLGFEARTCKYRNNMRSPNRSWSEEMKGLVFLARYTFAKGRK